MLGTLPADWAPRMLLKTINFATLVKEMSLTYHFNLGPIDSAKNYEIPYTFL